jgi:signal transduction histidine kinase
MDPLALEGCQAVVETVNTSIVIKGIAAVSAIAVAFGAGISSAVENVPTSLMTNLVQIRSVEVGGKPISWRDGETMRLKPFPKDVTLWFGAASNAPRLPNRLRYKLEGYDNAWRESSGEMYLAIRFLDNSGDQVDLKIFRATGESAGWNGAVESSTLTHRRETVVVPPRASQLHVVISSAGPPATMGIFVVDDLVVSRFSVTEGRANVLLRSPFGQHSKDAVSGHIPEGWIRDGVIPSMAKIVEIGHNPTTKAFAILDEDGSGHAEWRSLNTIAPQVAPGDQLVVEWNELFSMGMSGVNSAQYRSLPPGHFQFRAAEVTALGVPTGAEASLNLDVPSPFWKMVWFWETVAAIAMVISVASGRYIAWHRMNREIQRLQQQRLLEQERLRIAQNIHDDLGARVTQISLISGMAQGNVNVPEKARADFDRISRMARDLVTALYETVWAVNPENDNLDAMGNYLCQMVNQLCSQAQLRCRLHVEDLPRDVQLSSQTRHNITMAVKEAVHNVIKHARTSEVTLHATFFGNMLTISIQDDGCGFQMVGNLPGNGLTNMKRRLQEIGGTCSIESQAGRGTTVQLRMEVRPANGK